MRDEANWIYMNNRRAKWRQIANTKINHHV